MDRLIRYARELVAASRQVPVVRRRKKEPYSTCLGCGKSDGDDCTAECWALRLERASDNLEDALKAFTSQGPDVTAQDLLATIARSARAAAVLCNQQRQIAPPRIASILEYYSQEFDRIVYLANGQGAL